MFFTSKSTGVVAVFLLLASNIYLSSGPAHELLFWNPFDLQSNFLFIADTESDNDNRAKRENRKIGKVM